MRFDGVDKNFVSEMPHTIQWLREFEPIVNRNGCEIVIRDTDHKYDSIRLEIYSLNGDHEKAWEFYKQMNEYILSHCCKCGSTKGVRTIGEFTISSTVCEDCAEILSMRGLGISGPELELIPALKQGRRPLHIKCRLKAQDGHLFYKFSNELTFQDGKYVIIDNQKIEPIILSGVYTGLRDWKGERIYTGDVVLGEDRDGRKFWGMIMFGNNWGKSERDISPQWNNFSLVHGLNSFPSALCWAKKIEVIDNVVRSDKYVGPIPATDDYEIYYFENNPSNLKFSDE